MQWSEVIESPYLNDLPFKIELNRYGKIERTPASNKHARLQSSLHYLSASLKKVKHWLNAQSRPQKALKLPMSRGALKSLSSSTVMKRLIPVPLRCVLTLFRHPIQRKKWRIKCSFIYRQEHRKSGLSKKTALLIIMARLENWHILVMILT